jgi:hypothetical protein
VHGAAGKVREAFNGSTNGDRRAYALAEKVIDRVAEVAGRTDDGIAQDVK